LAALPEGRVTSARDRGSHAVPSTHTEPHEPMESPERLAAGRHTCAVKVAIFEGPLDLLVHLIRANEVDLHEIPIASIADQYLEYLELMRELDIDLAAEYLLMAATLAYLKSRMLLPATADEEDEEGEDPREELLRRLAEYALFKEAAEGLAGRPWLGRDVFPAGLDRSAIPEREGELLVSLPHLMGALREVLDRLPPEQRAHEVVRERITVQERMVEVMDRLRTDATQALRFEDLLLEPSRRGSPSRALVIATFLAILELAKIQALRIFQQVSAEGAPFGPIRVRLSVDPADLLHCGAEGV
jgi:segregation and condensation protein A